MELQIIRSKVDSPDWLNQLSQKYRRDHAEKLQKADEKRKREKLDLINEIATKLKLGKQDEPVETVVVEKPPKEDTRSQRDLILALVEALESLSDRVDALEQMQTKKRNDRVPVIHNEPSSRDIQILESKFEQIGLCGEIRKIITPFEVING